MPETKQPTRLTPFRPPTVAEVAAFYKLKDWDSARKVAAVRAALADGSYDPDGVKLDAAVTRMVDVVGRESFVDKIVETRLVEAREDAANFGATQEELRSQEEAEDPERFDGMS